jgi:hypothetical protein
MDERCFVGILKIERVRHRTIRERRQGGRGLDTHSNDRAARLALFCSRQLDKRAAALAECAGGHRHTKCIENAPLGYGNRVRRNVIITSPRNKMGELERLVHAAALSQHMHVWSGLSETRGGSSV